MRSASPNHSRFQPRYLWLSLFLATAIPAPAARADTAAEGEEAQARARRLGKALFSKSEIEGSGDLIGWSFAAARVAGGGEVVLAVARKPEPVDSDKEDSPAFPVARVGLLRGGKLVYKWSGKGRKTFGAVDKDWGGCDNGLDALVVPVALGGKQHVEAMIRCSSGEDCWHNWITLLLLRVEPDAAGKPKSLAQAWIGRGASAGVDVACDKQSCIASTTVDLALLPDGKTLQITSTDKVVYSGDKKDKQAIRACKPQPPRNSIKEAPYPLSPGGGMPAATR